MHPNPGGTSPTRGDADPASCPSGGDDDDAAAVTKARYINKNETASVLPAVRPVAPLCQAATVETEDDRGSTDECTSAARASCIETNIDRGSPQGVHLQPTPIPPPPRPSYVRTPPPPPPQPAEPAMEPLLTAAVATDSTRDVVASATAARAASMLLPVGVGRQRSDDDFAPATFVGRPVVGPSVPTTQSSPMERQESLNALHDDFARRLVDDTPARGGSSIGRAVVSYDPRTVSLGQPIDPGRVVTGVPVVPGTTRPQGELARLLASRPRAYSGGVTRGPLPVTVAIAGVPPSLQQEHHQHAAVSTTATSSSGMAPIMMHYYYGTAAPPHPHAVPVMMMAPMQQPPAQFPLPYGPLPTVTVGNATYNNIPRAAVWSRGGGESYPVPGVLGATSSPFAGAPMRFHPAQASAHSSSLYRRRSPDPQVLGHGRRRDASLGDDDGEDPTASSAQQRPQHLATAIQQLGEVGMRFFADLAEVERHYSGWSLAKEPAMVPTVSHNAVELFVGQVLPEVRMVTVLKMVLWQVAAQCNHRDLEGGIRECVVGRGKTAKAPGTKAYQITVLLPPEKPFPTNSVVTPQVVSAVNRSIFVEVESVPGGAPVHSDPTTMSPDGLDSVMPLPHPTTTTWSPPAAATADNSECRAWLWRHQQVMPVDLRATLERNLGGAISGHSSHSSNATAAASSALPEWRASSLVVELPYSRTKVQQPMLWLRSTAARSPRVML